MVKIINIVSDFIHKPFFSNKMTLLGLWVIVGIVSAVTKLHANNNFLIFRNVFWHTLDGKSLYAYYPEEYADHNLYGPLFSIIVAPFALVPIWIGQILWCLSLAMLLYWSVYLFTGKKGIGCVGSEERSDYMKIFIIWFCAHELLTALFMQQYNVAVAAGILFSFYFIEKEKDFWAAFWIVFGTFVKLYGIVGIAFFFFSKHKMKFISSLIFWGVVMFALPMIISSPEYIIAQYKEWFTCLIEKNDGNLLASHQNISLLGIVRKCIYALNGGYVLDGCLTGGTQPTYSDLLLIVPGCLAMSFGYFHVNKWKDTDFRLNVLAGVLMFVCLFSTGSESSGYIIALVGCCIWYCCVPWKRNKWDIALMVFALILTSFSPSDLFPKYLRQEFVQPFALKALPVTFIWLKLVFELCTRDYSIEKSK